MRRTITTDLAPKAIGPYSQGVENDGWVWVSMQLPIDPETGMMIDGDIALKAAQVIENIESIVKEAGGELSDIAKITLYLADMDDFADVNRAFERYFTSAPPARAALEVSKLPLGAKVAMDAVAKID